MKNLLFSFIFVLLAFQLLAQQHRNVLPLAENGLPHHSLVPQHSNPDQNQKTYPSGEDDFNLPIMANSEIVIRVDSIFSLAEDGNFKEIYTYDANGNMLTILYQNWENGAWVNFRLYTHTYDANGNRLTALSQGWENGEWVNSWLSTYTYDANGNRLVYLSQDWENGAWMNYRLYTYTYDANENMLTRLWQDWENGAWVDDRLDTFTYDANENMLTALSQGWENGAWVNFRLYTYTYDANENMLTWLWQNWENGAWVNFRLDTYTYVANGNMLTLLYQGWENGEWVNYWLSTYTYDANGNRLVHLYQNWETSAWVNDYLHTYTYDANGNMLTGLYQNWENSAWMNDEKYEYIFLPGQVNAQAYDWDGSNWIESSLNAILNIYIGGEHISYYYAINVEFYYTDITTGIEEQDVCLDNSPIFCYPNPVTDQINLEINPAWQSAHYLIELIGQTGQNVKSFEISSGLSSTALPLSVEDVPPGMYLLRVTAGKQIFSQKIIISK